MKTSKSTALALACVLALGGVTLAQAQESDSFKKYGQEFEGKIAKSYEDSEE